VGTESCYSSNLQSHSQQICLHLWHRSGPHIISSWVESWRTPNCPPDGSHVCAGATVLNNEMNHATLPLKSLQQHCIIFKIFIYLAVVGLSWSTWGLPFLSGARGIFSCGMRTLCCNVCDLLLWPGMEPRLPALGVWSLSHWTTREVPALFFLIDL